MLIAAACGGGGASPTSTPPPTNTPGSQATPTATTSVAPTPTPPGYVANVPRNETVISRGWGAGALITNPQDFNPFSNLYQRDRQHYTINESLFYTNFNDGEVIPWQARDYTWNGDYTELTITLRDGVMWSDGEQLTADDVVFTVEMLKEAGPQLLMAGVMIEWVESATAVDPLTVRLKLTKPGPRFLLDNLAQGQVGRFVVVPKHIWEGQEDYVTFAFYDPQRGWPVGTGPYQVSSASDQQIIFDLRADWWAMDAGLVDSMPAAKRVIYVNTQGTDALANLYITNQMDVGGTLPLGVYEASRAQNSDLVTWRETGPLYGAPDGCTFRLIYNVAAEPWDNKDVRWAINHAINRDQIVDIAYEGSQKKALVPFSSYGGVQAYLAPLQDLIDSYEIDDTDPAKVEARLTAAGFKKGADGLWKNPDGSDWPLTIYMGDGNPIGPVIAEQLRTAGFDAKFEVLQGTAFNDTLNQGNFGLMLFVHCGSIYDPWQTLDHFHSKYATPIGVNLPFIRATSRYSNPELDALLNEMESKVPSVNDPNYLQLVKDAMEIYLEDMPELTLAEEFHVVMFNDHYWTGWPTEDDPYVAPYIPWEGFNLVIHRLQPTGAQ
jgi:peptide/nickel transport system substrate-binding protein